MPLDTSPPALPRGTLDPNQFRKVIPILAARVQPTRVSEIIRHSTARRAILDIPKTRSVEPDPADVKQRLVLLGAGNEAELDQEAFSFIKERSEGIVPYDLELTYDFWNAEDILAVLLPPSVPPPSAFTPTGHIAHLNLRDHHLPYKHLIGEVLLSKTPSLRTVVNKLNIIDTKFRFFPMELLAGDPDYLVTLSESNCTFKFDFRTVYYNARLSTEHARLVSLLPPEALVADVFGGVGPFALPAAKKGCAVLLNDLNPESVRWARENTKINHVEPLVRISELDGVDFIRKSVHDAWHNPFPSYKPPLSSRQRAKQARAARQKPSQSSINGTAKGSPPRSSRSVSPDSDSNHGADPPSSSIGAVRRAPTDFILNLPSTALSFLSAFRGVLRPLMSDPAFSDVYGQLKGMPMVHVYCFAKKQDDEKLVLADILERASSSLAHELLPSAPGISLHWVRSVAPSKEMWCLSFRLPWEVAVADVEEDTVRNEQAKTAERAGHEWEDAEDEE